MQKTGFIVGITGLCYLLSCGNPTSPVVQNSPADSTESKKVHVPPDTSTIPHNEEGELIWYGRDLVLNTAYYLGPNGTKGQYLGNKMNCTNCHLDAGTRPFGLNFFSSHARYPQYRARENKILTLAERVNNCIERPHNGSPMPLDSREMIAIVTYIKWLGQDVPVNKRVWGDNGTELTLPDVAANPENGKLIYEKECKSCHGENGEGKMKADGVCFEYPPLWGPNSYQPGSSMFRVVKAAQFIKSNMPNGTHWDNPKLTDQEALDVAAYVNHPDHIRPTKKGLDYPNPNTKPVDYPFGPFTDPFSELQHKYGPWQPIIDWRTQHGLPVNK